MSDATFTFDDSQICDWDKVPERIRGRILNSWGNFMLKQTRQRFRQTVSPAGSPWPKTKFGKIRGKRRRFLRTLWGRGDLFRSITKYTLNKFTIGIGTKLPYAATHQFGAKFTATKKQSAFLFYNVFRPKFGKKSHWSWAYKIKIPARPFIGFSASDVTGLEKIAENYLMAGLTK